MTQKRSFLARYKLRLRRKRLLWRAFRKRRELISISRKTDSIKANDVLLFVTMRNEMIRIPWFLDHYRRLGVAHFLIVDNNSNDGTAAYLQGQPDVSLWRGDGSYKASRFGMDWLTALQWRYGHNHWVLTVDADELLIYPEWDTRQLPAFTTQLENQQISKMGALMLDLYPKGPIGDQNYVPGDDPTKVVCWFDPYGYWAQRQQQMDNIWCQGGPRARAFFASSPERAPTLNKIPLVYWQQSYVYVNSTHNALPVSLNRAYDEASDEKVSGVLLHTKFLPDAVTRAQEEKARNEHFADPVQYQEYYDAIADGPDLWTRDSVEYKGWRQLVDLRLMFQGKVPPR